MEQKEKMSRAKELEKALKEEKLREKEELRARQEANKKKREENARKTEIVQVVSGTLFQSSSHRAVYYWRNFLHYLIPRPHFRCFLWQ